MTTAAARRGRAALAAVLLGAAASCGGGGDGRTPGGMTLTSTAFDPGGPIPERFSCEGDNVPPPLRWTGTPAGTSQLALVVEDPDAPDGTFVHWLVVGIDPGVDRVDSADPLPGATVLPGSSDNPTYIGPCPPNGDDPHHYSFAVYALAAAPSLPDGPPAAMARALRRQASAGGTLTGTFDR